jgi:multimeric flavodoxin WrbA
MNCLIICGSTNPEGQTAQAASAFREGLELAHASVETAFLPSMDVQRCKQCDSNGWGTCRTDGKCVIQDDLASLLEKMSKADMVVFATPVYYGDLSESMRAFLDRVRRVNQNQPTRPTPRGIPAIGICVAGGGGGGAPECCVHLERIIGIAGFDVWDMVPVRRQNLPVKLVVLKDSAARYAAMIKA